MSIPILNIYDTGLNIRMIRKEKKISVISLADAMGISVQSVYKWERGDAMPTIDNLVVLSRIFDMPINDILVVDERKVG